MINSRRVLAMEIVGIIFIIILGSALHFAYALSNNNSFVGLFSAVNESVWEHLKLAFWPSILWMLITLRPLKNAVNNFFPAKAVGTYMMVILIPAVFYSYTAFTGESVFLIDIATFIVAVVIGQIACYQLFKYSRLPKSADMLAMIAMTVLAIIFIIFTLYPPHLSIFQDPNTGHYGL